MRTQRPLRQQLLTALIVVFVGAFLVIAVGLVLVIPRLQSPAAVALYVAILLAADVVVFTWFGRYLVQRMVIRPLQRLVDGVETIAGGDYGCRLPEGGSEEMGRLSSAVEHMAERLISHHEQLAANVRSLEDTNLELTEARDELVRIEKVASAGRLAAGIAHEIGNPLGAVMGYLGVLDRRAGPEERELIAAAEEETRRIDRIVRGLLDYARPRESRVDATSVNDVVLRVVDLLATQGKLRDVVLEQAIGEDLPPVDADPFQLEQVLVNLVLNAVDAMESTRAATLVITTLHRFEAPVQRLPTRRRDDPPDVDYSHRRRFHQRPRVPRPNPLPEGGNVVEISVRDSGPGIPGELLEQIFEPFVTTKEPGKGTGLGLAVAARLTDAMGGTIRVTSREGEGATFTIVLPTVRSASEEPQE